MKRLTVAVLFTAFVVFAFPVSAEAFADTSVQKSLRQAENLAIRGQRDDAVEAYRDLLSRGIDNPDLRYNLGTLRLQQGDVGRAVLHLRTALRTEPALDDARHNLEIALAARTDQIRAVEGGGAFAFFGLDTWAMSQVWALFFCVAFSGAFLFALSAWLPRPTFRVWGYRLCALLVFAAITIGGIGYQLHDLRQRNEAVVLVREVPARMAPTQDATTSFTAHAGLYGTVLAVENGFVRLRLENGLDAWLPEASLAELGTLPPSSD